MSLDLNAAGAKVIASSGGGTSFADPALQTVQVNQTGIGNIPVTEANLESAVGTTADSAWGGSGVASLVALLKALVLRYGVPGAVSDGSGSITTGGTAQYLFSALTPPNGYMVQNNHASAILNIRDVGVASGVAGFQLFPGQLFTTPSGYRPPGAVSVFSTVSGVPFEARQW